MSFVKKHFPSFLYSAFFIVLYCGSFAQPVTIKNNSKEKTIVFGNEKIQLMLDYNKKANITLLTVNGQKLIEGNAGIYSKIKTKETSYSTLQLTADPLVKTFSNTVQISNIKYGGNNLTINENWIFTITKSNIRFSIEQTFSKAIVAEKYCSPVFEFNNINTWEGAYQDYGGLAWFYLFNHPLDTYGVYSSSSDFWNSKTGNGLTITVSAPDKQIAMDYSRTANDRLAYTIAVSPTQMQPRFDADTKRRMYVRDTTDIWAPVNLPAGKNSESITLSYFGFNDKYGRGNLKGINQDQVSAVLNTIARIGVIGKKHFGGNSWHTPYGPICLHEQYIAQMGIGINDNNYLKGYQDCLDFYRDNAVKSDGRVWPRWAYSNEDAMPRGYTDKGFYEAQWGYLLDANPDLVTNVAELYNQTGNLQWVKTHQVSCEKALDWLLKRDSNNNGLVEMITDSHTQKRGSDWIDIIWASYENAFVNAKLYYALVLWAGIEKQLGNTEKVSYYTAFAQKLKTSFNKPTRQGGFWDDEKKCFIHWRDKDGSTHGNNMVTPVNFMAIAYGICDDAAKTKSILDGIETQMQKEQLFFWPLCMYSYAPGEGNDWQFPFPNYENGDLFLSWGAVGVKAYANYQPELALQYVKNVLAQYAKDGLAFQRYGRNKQDGLGDDILSGNCLAVVGLYDAIYGIRPMYNRFYLDPHITKELAGTQVKYNYRNQQLVIDLEVNKYAVSNSQFKIIAAANFGFYSTGKELIYFNGGNDKAAMTISTPAHYKLTADIKKWGNNSIVFIQSSGNHRQNLNYSINDLTPHSVYKITINGKLLKQLKTDAAGSLVFDYLPTLDMEEIAISKY